MRVKRRKHEREEEERPEWFIRREVGDIEFKF